MNNEVYMENWSIFRDDSDKWNFVDPELRPNYIKGNVYNHPTMADGSSISTSRIEIIWFREKKIKTFSRMYKLGKPCEKWLEFLKSKGRNIEEYLNQDEIDMRINDE